jgi:hypothetical protein
MVARDQKSKCRRAAVHIGRGVHVGSGFNKKLGDLGEVQGDSLAIRLDPVRPNIVQQGRAMTETRSPVNQRWVAGEQASQLLDISSEQGIHGDLEVRVGRACPSCFNIRPIGEAEFPGDGLPSIVQREIVVHDVVSRVSHQFGMPTGDVRDHRPVASFLRFDNPVCLPVKLLTNGKSAKTVC